MTAARPTARLSPPEPEPTAGPAAPTFEAAFAQYAGYALGLLRRLGVDAEDVEDVAQDVFMVVHRGLAGFEGRSTFKTWLCGICLRKASHYRRSRGRRPERASANLPETRVEAGQEAAIERRELRRQLEAALERLSEAQRQVFVLFELQELDMEQVAAIVDCPASTAYGRLYAARRIVQAHMRRATGPTPTGRPT